MSAGQLVAQVGNLDNTQGTIIQTGAGDTNITLTAPGGTLNNTLGRIAVNSRKLTLGAGTLANTDGKIEHAGTGTLAITAGTLNGQRGQITGNGALTITAGDIDHRNATVIAQQITISAANLDNRAGRIAQLSAGHTSVTVGGNLNNGAGKIESNGDATIDAATLDNSGGRIAAVGNASVGASASLNNTDGFIAGGANLAVRGGNVDNTRGSLQALAGDATLRVADLNNTAGSVYASGKLDTVAANVSNTGSLYAAGEQSLVASGAIANSGVIAAHGRTTIVANSLDSGTASLLGAGVKADGSLAQAGDLTVTTTQALAAHGQNLAAGRAALTGASVDVSGSQMGATDIALNASGIVTTSNAAIVTPGTLAVTAGQGLVNAHGTLSTGQLVAQVGNLDNTQGTIIQSGAGDTNITLTAPGGTLNNTLGRIAVNSRNLTLGAGTLVNTDGKIEHAGTGALAINAGTLNGQRGQITANGSLAITAGDIDHRNASTIAQQITISAASLDNRAGNFTQLGGGHTGVNVSGALDNRGGTIASNGDTGVSSGALNNQGGIVQAAGAAGLSVAAIGTLDNSNGGHIAGGGNTSLSGGDILNQSGQVSAGGSLNVVAAQGIHNGQGLLAANGDVQLSSATLDNTGGKLASVLGNVTVATSGASVNDSGVIQAAGDVALRNGGLSNTQAASHAGAGAIIGRNITIDSHGQAIDNRLGTIAATQALDARGGALANDGGLLQAGAALTLAATSLSNTNAAGYAAGHSGNAGGIVSGGAAALHLGDWNNAGGFFGAGGAVTGSAGRIDNTLGGQIVGQSSVNLNIAGLENQGGQVQALGDLALQGSGGVIDNRRGLIRSGTMLTMAAARIDNRDTQGAGSGLEGRDVALNTADLNNARGAVRADNDVAIAASTSVDNSQGLISAGRDLSIADPGASRALAVTNTGGTLIGSRNTNIVAASLSGDGRLLSLGDLALNLSAGYTHGSGGEITTNGSAAIVLGGDFSNTGKLRAGATLAISARNIENTASGDISASVTRLSAAGVLNNRGAIDGVNTELNAATLNNLGTGKIFGEHVSIAAGVLNNDVEGGVAASIAARDRLDIGAQTINNREHALILSGGDMAIGGALDANRRAVGRAGVVTNASASIEALGQLNLSTTRLDNLNNHFAIGWGPTSAPQTIVQYQGTRIGADPGPNDNGERVLSTAPGVYLYNDESMHLATPVNTYESWNQYNITRTTRQSTVVSSDPGRIVAGGGLTIDADNILNSNSHILAGGLLSIGAAVLSNPETQGQRITTDSGTVTANWRERHHHSDNSASSTSAYAPPDLIETISLSDEQHGTVAAPTTQQGKVPGAATAASVNGGASAAGTASATVNRAAIAHVAAGVDAVGASGGQQAAGATGANSLSGSDRTGNAGLAGAFAAATGARAAGATGANGLNGSERTGNAGLAGALAAATGSAAGAAVGSHGADHAGLSVAGGAGAGATAAGAADTATAAAAAGAARVGRIEQVALAHPAGGAQVVRTSAPATRIPNASLYAINASRSAGYLIETDPRFANYRQWLGSDYMLGLVQLDPNVTQKRLGDGYYEQSLVRAQVAQLTGRRYLGDYASDDDEYRALMDSGVAYAKTWNLRPGIALTSAQMAALSSDIVWLVEKEVTLADGSVQKVLAPQVYVRLRDGDIDGSGSLLSGKDVDIHVTGDLVNSGTIAGRDILKLTADNVQNLGGRIHGDAVAVAAKTDLNNIGGTISANSALVATAGRDINIATTTRAATSVAGGNSFSRTTIDRVAGLYVTGDGALGGGTLVATAGRGIKLLAGQIGNAGKDGATVLNAGRNVELGTVTTASADNIKWDANNYRKDG
ncbi:adhesin HecA-like repeat protein, partial [Oxalobacteraceae bacterium GrIS 1.11]